MTTLEELTNKIISFRDERDWAKFHTPKDVAISMILEAGEVLEHFQWKSADEVKTHIKSHRDKIGDELIDVLYWVLLLLHDLKVPLDEAFERKMTENAKKYPADLVKGKNAKYTAYQDKLPD